MNEDILEQLKQTKQLFAEAAPTDAKLIERYAWIICKSLTEYAETIGSLQCRQFLAEVIKLPVQRPSLLYSSILRSAVKVHSLFLEFHFANFLRIWGLQSLRKEDYEPYRTSDGKTFPSLAEKTVKRYLTSVLYRPEEIVTSDILSDLQTRYGYHDVTQMIVTRIQESDVKGRRMRFVTLVSREGDEVSCEIHSLHSILTTDSDKSKKHYVNVGQVYDVILRNKKADDGYALIDAVLSRYNAENVFPTETGYVQMIDHNHNHIHIYDKGSRHFVSSGQRQVVQVGQYVKFVPIIPKINKFKTAIIIQVLPLSEGEQTFGLRKVKITYVDKDKGYCAWEFTDGKGPVFEIGKPDNSFNKGYLNLAYFDDHGMAYPNVDSVYEIVVFLKRNRDVQKRPYVAFVK